MYDRKASRARRKASRARRRRVANVRGATGYAATRYAIVIGSHPTTITFGTEEAAHDWANDNCSGMMYRLQEMVGGTTPGRVSTTIYMGGG